MDELLDQFVIEATELVQQAADDLLLLEREPANTARIESLFRAVHTLKGSVGLFDFVPLQTTLFAAEDVLTAAHRAGEIDSVSIDPLLAIIEWVDSCVRHLKTSGTLPSDTAVEAVRLRGTLSQQTPATPGPIIAGSTPGWAQRLFERYEGATVALRYVPRPDCFFSGDDPIAILRAVPELLALDIAATAPWPAPEELDPFTCALAFEAASAAAPAELEQLFRLLPDQVTLVGRPRQFVSTPAPVPAPEAQGRQTMRVDVGRIEALVDIVGELFIAKNSLGALAKQAHQIVGGLALARNIAQAQETLDGLAARLQRATGDIRMVPLGETMRRLPRVAREVSAQLGKPVDLEIEGEGIEADKSIVDALFDPLLHVLRNAIDHGIEAAPLRKQRGKPERGRISISARRAGYRIEITVTDDGGGVDIEAVRAAAVHKGIVSLEAAAELDEPEVIELLFRSGFSTTGRISDISGRGVGMDAVRRAVQKLGGRVALDSTWQQGTAVTLSLPMSLAVSRIMIVDTSGDRYAVPMESITETLRLRSGAINRVRAGEAFVLRDRTVPVARLADLLGLPVKRRDEELVLVAETSRGRVGLVIDSIGDRLETLLRPAAGLLKTVSGISGTTVLGDGSVVMVLDLEALVR